MLCNYRHIYWYNDLARTVVDWQCSLLPISITFPSLYPMSMSFLMVQDSLIVVFLEANNVNENKQETNLSNPSTPLMHEDIRRLRHTYETSQRTLSA